MQITVDQWLLEHVRSLQVVSAAYGAQVYAYEVPAGIAQPYILIQAVSGVRGPKTQVLRDSGASRFQIDAYREDRYQGRTDIEEIMKDCMVHNLLDRGLRIEHCEVSGPRQLPSEVGFRFSCDVMITWTQEE